MNEFSSAQSRYQIRLPIAVSLIIVVGVASVSLVIGKINAWAENLTGANREIDITRMSVEGGYCGGIAKVLCNDGLKCVRDDSTNPKSAGKCVKI